MKELSKDFIEDFWFKNSLRTILPSYRSKGGYNLDPKRKEELKGLLFLSLTDFPIIIDNTVVDQWYQKTIVNISQKNNLSIGRSQKLLNILIKYFITSNRYLNTNDEISDKLIGNLKNLHIPIDRQVLKIIRKYDKRKKSFIDSNLNICLGNQRCPWSEISDYKTYFILQDSFRKITCENEKSSPIYFETEIWNNFIKNSLL